MKSFEIKAFSLIRWLNVPISVYICYDMEYMIQREDFCVSLTYFWVLEMR